MQGDFTEFHGFLRDALVEDIGAGDVTSQLTIPADAQAQMVFVAREALVVCGLPLLEMLCGLCDVTCDIWAQDGDSVIVNAQLATVSGSAQKILGMERVALNIIQHLSGIATQTRSYVTAVEGTGAQILDTRKTLPGWRKLQKYAVATGGGVNHRMGLDDAILIKDNHIAAAGGVQAALSAARGASVPVQIECDTAEQVAEAVAAGAENILLDNMSPTQMAQIVAAHKGIVFEASGGITLASVRAVAESGVQRISIGALTHSVRAVDIGLDVVT